MHNRSNSGEDWTTSWQSSGQKKIISSTFFFVTAIPDDLEMGWEPGDQAAGDDKYRAHSWRRNGGRRITGRPLSLERVQGTCQHQKRSRARLFRRRAFKRERTQESVYERK
jgi:hypothetical protein